MSLVMSRPWLGRALTGIGAVLCGVMLASSPQTAMRSLTLVPFALALLMGIAKSGSA